MIVYVESNFVLELALAQEEASSCEDVLQLAEARRVSLVLPAYSIAECYEVLLRRAKERATLHARVTEELGQLGRSQPYAQLVQGSSSVVTLLVQSGEDLKRKLEAVLTRILGLADPIPITSTLFASGLALQTSRSLQPQDALIYASVLADLPTWPAVQKCFLNRNSKDFVTPDITAELAAFDCRVIPRFTGGLGYIRARI